MSTTKWTLMSAGVLLLCARAGSAGPVYSDDFNDGNAQDGTPLTWSPGPGTWDASSGDYVATGSLPRVALVPAYVLTDTSIRAQVRVTGNVNAGLALRRPQFLLGYAGEIQTNGTLAISRKDGPDAPVRLGTSTVPFNPVAQDVMLQFDAIGSTLSLWAWRVGEPMPIAPQVVASDTTYAQGLAGFVSASATAVESDRTTFRFVEVADTHIVPEPSALLLVSLAGCGLLSARPRKRS